MKRRLGVLKLTAALLLAACASAPAEETDYWTGVMTFSGSEFQLRNARHHADGKVSEVYPRCLSGGFPRGLQRRAKSQYDGKSVVIVANLFEWPTDAVFVRVTYGGTRITNHYDCTSSFILLGRKVWPDPETGQNP